MRHNLKCELTTSKREIIEKAQNLINALDFQDVNDIEDLVNIEEEKETVESKSIWKPISELPFGCEDVAELKNKLNK